MTPAGYDGGPLLSQVGVATMDGYAGDAPVSVRNRAPNDPKREDPIDDVGRALIAALQQAAEISRESCERAIGFAAKLAQEPHAVEGRIKELEEESSITANARDAQKNG
jgi:hypothetical protein